MSSMRDTDLDLVFEIINSPDVPRCDQEAFDSIRASLLNNQEQLTPKQRKWAKELKTKYVGKTPKHVASAIPEVLKKPLPLKPPGWKHPRTGEPFRDPRTHN